jgi:hypothetical protein
MLIDARLAYLHELKKVLQPGSKNINEFLLAMKNFHHLQQQMIKDGVLEAKDFMI